MNSFTNQFLNSYEIALQKEIIFANEVHGTTHKCDNNNVKISASKYKCSEVITMYSQLRRTKLISRFCLAT